MHFILLLPLFWYYLQKSLGCLFRTHLFLFLFIFGVWTMGSGSGFRSLLGIPCGIYVLQGVNRKSEYFIFVLRNSDVCRLIILTSVRAVPSSMFTTGTAVNAPFIIIKTLLCILSVYQSAAETVVVAYQSKICSACLKFFEFASNFVSESHKYTF